jgi:uracil-DNA glycosylase family 4
MDEDCTNCARAETRTRVVHGYGDAEAEFLVVGETPTAGAQSTGVPFTGDAAGERLQRVLGELGLSRSPPDDPEPAVQNVFLTYLTRCHGPDAPTDDQVRACEPFLNAEVRTINPEIIVPVGERTLRTLAPEFTTKAPDAFDMDDVHATAVRGRGFELVPMRALADQTDAETTAFVETMADLMAGDYRQTKGRRSR